MQGLNITTSLRDQLARKKAIRNMFPLGMTAVQLLSTNVNGKPFIHERGARIALVVPYYLMNTAISIYSYLQDRDKDKFKQREKQLINEISCGLKDYYNSITDIIGVNNFNAFLELPNEIRCACSSTIVGLRSFHTLTYKQFIEDTDVLKDLESLYACRFITSFVIKYIESSDLLSCEPCIKSMYHKCTLLYKSIANKNLKSNVIASTSLEMENEITKTGKQLETQIKGICIKESTKNRTNENVKTNKS